MDYETFSELCRQKGVKPADVSRATGIATATLTSWKKGAYTPKQDKMQKISDYFNVDPMPKSHEILTFEERAILNAYRSADEGIKSSICKLLDVKRDSRLSREA